jgi:hypothetical protein
MDRRLARKNLRVALISGAIIFVMFGMSWVAAALYVA